MKNFTTSYPLSKFFKEREIEKYVKPEEPEPEPQPEEIPIKGIQASGLKSSLSYSFSLNVYSLCCCTYVVCLFPFVCILHFKCEPHS